MPNALAAEKSPYLLQHADNPVDWFPWGEAAFAKARAEQKPIFLSIGYSTCHWCHVMAHESFENPAIAALLNEHFVAIKVDREERPDVDRVYMTYVQSLTGHGGWPLSAWLTPELKPFHGGTYFPPEDRHGRAGFPSLLRAIIGGWANERAKLVDESERVIGVLRQHADESSKLPAPTSHVSESDLAEAAGAAFEKGFQYFYEAYDAEQGGFGGAPKFPRGATLNFLFRCAALQGVDSGLGAEALRMTVGTLQQMARGGIHDQVGGGFHRYSVDARWFVPHFEKMLYDQAQIALNYLDARLATGDERHAWLARDIFDYVERDLTSPHGGFYSAEDADSAPAPAGDGKQETDGAEKARHVEGAFYVWTQEEIARELGADAPFFCAHFGILENGNVPPASDPHGEFTGKNILAQMRPLAESAQLAGLTLQVASDRLGAALAKLRAVRARRPRPQRDDKIITAWNGLMISAYARGHCVLEGRSLLAGDERSSSVEKSPASRLLPIATRAAEFLRRELYDASRGVLYRSFREGRGTVEGFAEDHAFLVQGLLDLYEASFELRWLQWAEQLQATMDARFWDEARGGYFNSAAEDASIVLRLKEDYDGAEPAPSSVAAMNLFRLGAVLERPASGGESYRERGRRTVGAFRAQWSAAPHALPQMLSALELALDAPRHVVLAGDPAASDFRALAAVLVEKIGPRRSVLAVNGGEDQRWLAARAPWLEGMKPVAGRAAAYVCEEFACQAPVTESAELRDLLR